MRVALRLLFLVLLLASFSAQPSIGYAADCEFVLGFKAIHDMMPDVVGDCLVNEHHNPINGDGLQETTGVGGKGGLLVWRKADNWTAYTDGYRTWVNGPNGLQQRLNTERFPWEKDTLPSERTNTSGVQWATYSDGVFGLKYPTGWTLSTHQEYGITRKIFTSPDARARFDVYSPTKSTGIRPADFLTMLAKALAASAPGFSSEPMQSTTINGLPAVQQAMQMGGAEPGKAVVAVIERDGYQYQLVGTSDLESWPAYWPQFSEMIQSYTLPSANW